MASASLHAYIPAFSSFAKGFYNVQSLYAGFFEKLGPEDVKTFLDLEEKIMVLFTEADEH